MPERKSPRIFFSCERGCPARNRQARSGRKPRTVEIEGRAVALNEYYVRHPEMMLGQMKLKGTMYRDKEPTLVGELTQGQLEEALEALPEGVYIPRDKAEEPPPAAPLAAPEAFIGIKDGGYAFVDGKIVIRSGDTFKPTSLSATAAMQGARPDADTRCSARGIQDAA